MNDVQVLVSGVRGAVAAMDAIGFIDTSKWFDKKGKANVMEIAMDTVVPAGIFFVAFKGLQMLANRSS